ncbi:MAG TPA: hypothetical protein VJ183_01700 [Chloroflexia bacterium]|nr:hypothetical protein [Chloroflexia bacterium]
MSSRSRDEYVEAVKSQLAGWDDEIERFDARADIILMKLEERYYDLLRALRTQERSIRDNLYKLGTVSGDNWMSLKSCLDRASRDMEHVLSVAAQEIK